MYFFFIEICWEGRMRTNQEEGYSHSPLILPFPFPEHSLGGILRDNLGAETGAGKNKGCTQAGRSRSKDS